MSSCSVELLKTRVVLTVTLESAQSPPAPTTVSELEASPKPYLDGIYSGVHGRTIVPGVELGADDVVNSHTFVIVREQKHQFAKLSISHGRRALVDEALKALSGK